MSSSKGPSARRLKRALGVDDPVPGEDRLVERGRAIHPVRLVRLPVPALRSEGADISGKRRDLIPIFSQSRGHRLHHVRPVERVGHDGRVDAQPRSRPRGRLRRAASWPVRDRRAGSSSRRCSPCGTDSIVRKWRLRAPALPKGADDRLLVDAEVHGEPDLARVLETLLCRSDRPTHRTGGTSQPRRSARGELST